MLSMTSKKLLGVYSQFNDRVTVGNMQNKMQNILKMRKMHQNRLKIYYQMLSMASKKCGGGYLYRKIHIDRGQIGKVLAFLGKKGAGPREAGP